MNAESFAKQEEAARTKALDYLKAKFPAVDEQAFFTDYTGEVHSDVISFWAVAQASEFEQTCAACEGTCSLTGRNSRPVISVAQSAKGYSYLDVRWTCGLACRFEQAREFERMFKKSGLKDFSRHMTFKAYEVGKSEPETRHALCEAVNASKNGTCLILAGKPGTGKTHLASAIALRAMERGKQAIFRLVSAMLDEIQATIRDNADYDGLMRQFKNAPCLVLDDLGHENMTPARASYLHQIIDYRYGEGLQTIVTTNARTPEELCAWSGEAFIAPIISRLMANGSWVTISQAQDRRQSNG